MTAILLDTHVWAWSLTGTSLPVTIAESIAAAEAVYVSPISFFEIGQKVRIGKWPEMERFVQRLPDVLRDQGGFVASFTPEIALKAALLDWPHRDPLDRILAATCLTENLPIASVDTAFDSCDDDGIRIRRIG